MCDAAQHVYRFSLTQTKTHAYVGELLAQTGESVKIRLTAPVLINRMKKLRESLDGAAVLRRLRALRGELEAPQRQPIAGEIDRLREVLSAISREMRAR